ncbi:hypothetical protein B296_00008214 [Ensete ventricosum]|uniref:Uncharacterized protein n=1 Tax=Ensete ventricosum TaxID=4639 RepID=A0A427APE6_ENSVE|nr:hypothetical protein B296_00008214 [Ensete ventricosum]
MGVAVYLSIDQRKLIREYRDVEAGGQKGRGSDKESKGAQLPESKASIRMEVDLEECHSVVEADLPITKGRRCKATNSSAIKGRTFVESLIPCSDRGRALIVKGVEEVENAEANSKYQDKSEGQRPRNFIRSMSADFSSR